MIWQWYVPFINKFLDFYNAFIKFGYWNLEKKQFRMYIEFLLSDKNTEKILYSKSNKKLQE